MEFKIPNIHSFLDPAKEDAEDASLIVRADDLFVIEIDTNKESSKPAIVLSKQQVILLRDTLDLVLKNDLINDVEEEDE